MNRLPNHYRKLPLFQWYSRGMYVLQLEWPIQSFDTQLALKPGYNFSQMEVSWLCDYLDQEITISFLDIFWKFAVFWKLSDNYLQSGQTRTFQILTLTVRKKPVSFVALKLGL